MKNIILYYLDFLLFLEEQVNKGSNSAIINKKKIYLCILKSQFYIKIFLLVHLIIFYILKIFLFNKKNLILKLYKTFYRKNIFIFKKVLQLIFALIELSKSSKEKIIRLNFLNKNKINDNYFENIIIGSGPSGSVTAVELLKKKKETLILEKGKEYDVSLSKHPYSEFYYKWKNVGISGAIGNFDFQYASAECVGGGSEINSGLFHDLDENFLNMLKKNNKNNLLVKKNFKWKKLICYPKLSDYSAEEKNLRNYFKLGSKKLNYKLENLKIFYKKNFNKNSMTKTLLKKVINLGGYIYSNTEVLKIKKKGNYWEIKAKFKRKEKKKFKCKRLFLCCGSPYTTFLLKNSNIIKSNFNQNFHFHPMLKIIAKFPKKVNSEYIKNVINVQITEFYPNFLFGNAASNKEFLKIFSFGSNQCSNDINAFSDYMSIFHVTFSFGYSKFIKIPFINDYLINYKINKEDERLSRYGLKKLSEFVLAAGAEYIYLQGDKCTKVTNIKELDKTIDTMPLKFSSVHLLGGMMFGQNKNALLNSFGKFNDNKYYDLFINDSTLCTENLLKNPQGTIMAIAEQNIKNAIKNFK
jgi:hypothetical protein